jgi:hypothetical protein
MQNVMVKNKLKYPGDTNEKRSGYKVAERGMVSF